MSQKSLPQQSSLNFFSCLLVLDFFLLIDAIFIVSIRKKKSPCPESSCANAEENGINYISAYDDIIYRWSHNRGESRNLWDFQKKKCCLLYRSIEKKTRDMRLQVLSLIAEEADVQELQLSVFPLLDKTATKLCQMMIRGKLDHFLWKVFCGDCSDCCSNSAEVDSLEESSWGWQK